MSKGLLTLQTNLKSLRYGSDKPYITKDINNAPSSNQISRRIDDTSRIAQMLIDRPGLKYLANEALLYQAEAKSKKSTKKTFAGAFLEQLGSTIGYTLKVAGSTLVQVPVNGTGTHFLKAFKTNTYLQPAEDPDNPISGFAKFFGAGGIEGTSYAQQGTIVPGNHTSEIYDQATDTWGENGSLLKDEKRIRFIQPTEEGISPDIPNQKSNFNFSNNRTEVLLGHAVTLATGPLADTTEAPYTLGRDNTIYEELSPFDPTIQNESRVYSIDSNYLKDKINPQEVYVQKTEDEIKADPEGPTTKRKETPIVAKERRINLGDQGASLNPYKYSNMYWTTSNLENPEKSLEIDQINALRPQTAKTLEESGKVDGTKEGRDLIKFRFHIITPDAPETVLYFRAFLDSFDDSYSAQWSPIKYIGRAEDFQVYGGFNRKITLSFKIAAATRSEMKPLYEKMIWLASATAPTYADGGQFMRGTITKITVGDYVYELPGVLNSVRYAWNTDYPWEIAITEPENLGMDDFEQELPMVMDCSIDFTPIHEFTPTTGLRKYITSNALNKGITDIDKENTGIGRSQAEIKKEKDDAAKEQLKKENEEKERLAKEKAEQDRISKQAVIDAEIAKQDKMEGVTIVNKRAFGPITEKQAARDDMKAATTSAAFNIPRTNFVSNS